MFGYVMANQNGLSEKSKERYRAAYCGLCHALGKRHGQFSRLTLTYDLAFLAIFLSALYEKNAGNKEAESFADGRCLLHPLKKHKLLTGKAVDYAADMNIALSYYNLLDNWQDDKNYLARAEAGLLKKQCLRVESKYVRQCGIIKESLKNLASMEQDNVLNPDLPANCFGRLMAEIFAWHEDENSEKLRRFGFALGKYIYLLDAVLDLKKDIKQEKYNPLTAFPKESFRDSLSLLMYDCTAAFGEFDELQEDELLKNILYSGVWLKYEMQTAKAEQKQAKKQKKPKKLNK